MLPMVRILYVAGFRDSTRTESHVAAAFREWGHEVTEHRLHGSSLRSLPKVVSRDEPDIVFWTYDSQAVPASRRRIANESFAAVKSLGTFQAAYHLDRYWDLARENCITDEPWFHGCDLVMTADGGNQERFAQAGVNHVWMPPAVHGPDAELGGDADDQYRCKVAFVGSWRNYHPEWPWRLEMIAALQSRYGDDFRCFPQDPHRPIRGQDLNDLYASVDVVVGDSIFAGTNKGRLYHSDRVYETIGRGGCLAFPHVEGLERSFKDGTHLRYFDAGDPASMFEVVDDLLSDPRQRDHLRTFGHDEVMRNHLYRHRANEIMQRMVEQRPSLIGWTADARPNTWDAVAIREVWYDNAYRAKDRLRPGDTVVDLGANVGAFTIWAARQGCNVIAVEPMKENIEQLTKNIRAMGVSDKVTIMHTAVGEKAGHINMSFFDTDRSQSAYRTERTDVELISVPVTPLSQILPDGDVAFLKVDIEGSEIFALQNADLKNVKRVAVETHNVDPPHTTHKEVKAILKKAGFAITETGGHAEGYVYAVRKR